MDRQPSVHPFKLTELFAREYDRARQLAGKSGALADQLRKRSEQLAGHLQRDVDFPVRHRPSAPQPPLTPYSQPSREDPSSQPQSHAPVPSATSLSCKAS